VAGTGAARRRVAPLRTGGFRRADAGTHRPERFIPGLAPDVPSRTVRRVSVWFDGAQQAWVIGGREPAIRVLRDADTFTVDDPRFSTARVVGPSMLSLDGDAHRRHRSPFAALLCGRDLEPAIAAEAQRLIAALPADADLMGGLAGPLAAWTAGAVLGLDVEPRTLLGWYRAIVAETERLALDPGGDACRPAAVAELGAAVLMAAPVDGGLSDDEVVSNAAVVLFGAIETTEGMIANLLTHLLTEPGALDSVRSDRRLVDVAIEESLRLEPSVTRVDRFATTDIDLDGHHVARGDMVLVSLAAANRDPAYHTDPDRFRLDRVGEPGHLTFVQGPHACIGAHLARAEARAAVNAVLDRFPALELVVPPVIEGEVFRKPSAVRVRHRQHGPVAALPALRHPVSDLG
jgi:cytochrome P450